jgi:hypothetical protein
MNKQSHYLTLSRWEFDRLALLPNPDYTARVANIDELLSSYNYVKSHLQIEYVSLNDIENVYFKNKRSFYIIEKQNNTCGVYALLMLNTYGFEKLLLNEINFSKIDTNFLSMENEQPVAIYKWAIVSPGTGLSAFKCMSKILLEEKFRQANLYLRAATKAGLTVSQKLGFHSFSSHDLKLRRYIRLANQPACHPLAA